MQRETTVAIRQIETFRNGHLCFVRVSDDDGVGWGQTAPYHADLTEEFLHRTVAPWVLERDAEDVERVVEVAIDRNYKFTGTFLYRAVGGIDTALWDLRGRQAGVSVCELLGGTPRPIRAYGSSMRRDNSAEEEVERLVQEVETHGYEAVKIKVGPRLGRDDDVDGAEKRTLALVPALRRALPERVRIFADANGSYSADQAIEIGRWLADEGVSYFEEPCPHTDLAATAAAAHALEDTIIVTGGEQDYLPAIWKLMIDTRAVHIVQPDVLYNGGICRTLAVARQAAECGLNVMPHAANRSMLQVFTAHLMAALPNAADFMEFSIEPTAWTEGLFASAPVVHGGMMPVPDGPGWGIEPDAGWLKRAERRVTRRD